MHHTKCWMGWITTWNQDCHFFLGRKARANLNSVLKCKDITLLTKVHIVKAMFFPIVMYACENGTKKKPKGSRIDAFKLWWWRRLLRVSWSAGRSNQSILKDANPEYSLEGLILKLKLWLLLPYVKSQLIGKDTHAKHWSQKEKRMAEDEMVRIHHWFNGHEFEETLGDSEGWRSLTFCSPWGFKELNMIWWLNTTDLLIQFSCSAVSSCLCPHGLQHFNLPCPSPTPRACSNSCPLSWWCYPTILSSVSPVSSCLQSFPALDFFSNRLVLHIKWLKYWNFNFSISPSNEYSGLISFRMDWFYLLAVQGTLKTLLQHHSSKASVLQCSTFFMVQL